MGIFQENRMHHMYAKRRPEKMWWVALICMGIAASVMASKAVVAQTTVVVSQGIDPRMLDPAHDTLVSSRSIMSNIYDTLLWRDSTGLATPSLAKSWEFLDNTTLRLHLRDDVKFHDGSAFSAADREYGELSLESSGGDGDHAYQFTCGVDDVHPAARVLLVTAREGASFS